MKQYKSFIFSASKNDNTQMETYLNQDWKIKNAIPFNGLIHYILEK